MTSNLKKKDQKKQKDITYLARSAIRSINT